MVRTLTAALLVAAAVLSLSANAYGATPPAQTPDRYRTFLFGVDYYPELCPESLWEQDAATMKAAGVNVVRIGEFAWSLMEPREGEFDFSLFDRSMVLLRKHGIKVIFGTPTATPPKWLTSKYPETLHVFPTGQASNDQTRRHYCYNSEVYRRLSRRIVEELGKHYANSTDIVGWQIDNELNNENKECYSQSCRAAFRRWLKAKYGTLDALNERWGTRFWSQWYTDWEQIDLTWPATGFHSPALVLDFKRFISDSCSSYKSEQVEILRRYRPNDFLTHNGLFRNVDQFKFSRDLDLHSYSNYPSFASDPPRYPTGAALTLLRGVSGRMMIMEQLTGPTGQTYLLRTPKPGQMRLWAWQAVAHGADGMVHFNWRTARRGAETYWYGVIDADSVPRARYDDFKREGAEMNRVGPELLGSKIVSDVAVIKDYEAEWAFDHQYLTSEVSIGAFYTALFRAASDLKLNVDFVSQDADLSRYKIVFAPALVLTDPELAGRMKSFVAGGGILVASAHTAVRDRDNALTDKTIPAGLTDLFGAELDSFACYEPPSADANAVAFADGTSSPITVFAEILKPTTAKVVGTWRGDYMAGAPACTENRSGRGTAVYYGSFFNPESARLLLARYAKEAKLEPLMPNVPVEVEVTRRTKGQVSYYFLLNHANAPVEVAPGAGFVDMLTGKTSEAKFTLEPFGYRILRR